MTIATRSRLGVQFRVTVELTPQRNPDGTITDAGL
jgi:hypothetical protein